MYLKKGGGVGGGKEGKGGDKRKQTLFNNSSKIPSEETNRMSNFHGNFL